MTHAEKLAELDRLYDVLDAAQAEYAAWTEYYRGYLRIYRTMKDDFATHDEQRKTAQITAAQWHTFLSEYLCLLQTVKQAIDLGARNKRRFQADILLTQNALDRIRAEIDRQEREAMPMNRAALIYASLSRHRRILK